MNYELWIMNYELTTLRPAVIRLIFRNFADQIKRKQKMKIEEQITVAALAAVKELYGTEVPEKMIQLQKTRSDFEGNLTLVTFPLLKTSHKKPEIRHRI